MGIKTWNVSFMHPDTRATSHVVVYAKDKMEATRKARIHYAPVYADSSCCKIISIEELA